MSAAFVFQIRPLALQSGFELTCEGIPPDAVTHERLADAIAHSFVVGRSLDAEICIFTADGDLLCRVSLLEKAGICRRFSFPPAEGSRRAFAR